MKLLYVVSRWGEPTETFVRREIAAGHRAGHHIEVVSLKAPLPVPDGPAVLHLGPASVLPAALVDVVRHPRRAWRVLRLLRGSSPRNLPRHAYALMVSLAHHPHAGRPDWVHAHFAWLSATTAWGLARSLDVPFGVMPHAHDIYEDRLVDGLLRRKLRAASLVVVESARIRQDVAAALGCDPAVLRMGVPDDYVSAERAHDGRGVQVVSVGALRQKKGHGSLIEAVAGLPDTRLHIIGEGPERAQLTALIEDMGAVDRIRLLGHLAESDVARELDRADVFALASTVTPHGDRDGVPNVLIEAMARGVPVVSTDVAGIPDLLLPDRGTVVPSSDTDRLRTAIAELVDDPALRTERSRNARAHVRDHYTVGANWQRLETMITGAIDSCG